MPSDLFADIFDDDANSHIGTVDYLTPLLERIESLQLALLDAHKDLRNLLDGSAK